MIQNNVLTNKHISFKGLKNRWKHWNAMRLLKKQHYLIQDDATNHRELESHFQSGHVNLAKKKEHWIVLVDALQKLIV